MRSTIVRSALLASATLLLLPAAVSAQSVEQTNQEAGSEPPAPEATAAPDNEGQDTATGEIVVTARRVEENLQRVPASVSAFNERALERIQAIDPTGLQGAVPNLNIVQGRGSSNATNIFIRGIGQPDALQTFDPAVGLYVDDVYYSRIRGTQLDLLDVERMEVLRGPQGTLYGKNTIGGALKVVTRRPGSTLRGNISAAVGNYDQREIKASVSGPLSPGFSAGLSVLRSKRDGFVRDRVLDRRYNDKDTTAGRATLAITPSDRLRVDLTADISRDDTAMTVGQPINSLTYLFGGTALALPTNPNPDDYDFTARTSATLPNSSKMTHWGTHATVAYDLSDALTLRSITAYRDLEYRDYIDIDATQLENGGDVLVDVDQNQRSQEFQLTWSGERVQGVAGFYYLKENVGSHQEAYGDELIGPAFGNPTFLRTIDDDLATTSVAGYLNGSLSLTDALRLSAGIRYTREEKEYFRTTTASSNITGPFAPLFNNTVVFNRKGKWNDVSPMVSLDYQFSRAAMVYARYAKGFKSGGFNGRANSAAEAVAYEPETVHSYEGGFKSTLAGMLRLNGAVFWNDYRDFQARVSSTDASQGVTLPTLTVFNAGKLRIRGAELEAALTPVAGLLLDTQIGYLDADYKEFADVRFTATGGSRAFQTPAFSPKWTMRFGSQYSADLGSSGSVTFGGQLRYRSRTALSVDNTFTNSQTEIAGLFQPSYWLTDARIVWENAAKRLAVGLYGQNLGDQRYKTEGQDFSSIASIRTVYYGAPRTWQLRVTARY
jgi:iron complex outermembrane receptor protein